MSVSENKSNPEVSQHSNFLCTHEKATTEAAISYLLTLYNTYMSIAKSKQAICKFSAHTYIYIYVFHKKWAVILQEKIEKIEQVYHMLV